MKKNVVYVMAGMLSCMLNVFAQVQNENILPDGGFASCSAGDTLPTQGWIFQYNDDVSGQFIEDAACPGKGLVLKVVNPVDDKGVTVRGSSRSHFEITEPGKYRVSVWVRADAGAVPTASPEAKTVDVHLRVIRNDWKAAFSNTRLASTVQQRWSKHEYEFVARRDDLSSTSGQPFVFRIDITGTGTFYIAEPELVALGPDDTYSSVEKDIRYKDVSPGNVFDIYYPIKGEGLRPTHILIHGGGWTGGRKDLVDGSTPKAVFDELARAGFIGISVEYRLVDKESGPYLRTCVVDCMDALRYIFTHAQELGVDTDNVFVWGGSAGGQLSLICATAPQATFPGSNPVPEGGIRFKGVVAWVPPTDMLHYEEISVEYNHKLRDLSRRMGRSVKEDPDAFIEVSPLEHLTRDDPPVHIFHGDMDRTVNLQHSIRFKEKADRLGIPCELQIIHNANHGFKSANGEPIEPGIDFIEKGTAQFFINAVADRNCD